MFKQIAKFAAFALVLAMGAIMFDQKSRDSSEATARVATPAESRSAGNGKRIVAITADPRGHFMVAGLVNGVHVEMLADTGASAVVLQESDARRIGIDMSALNYSVRMSTANGIARAARVTLDEVAVGGITLRDVDALVAQDGALNISLLGMTFIGKVARFELRGDQLILSD
jgi:aspartyl protease family protein